MPGLGVLGLRVDMTEPGLHQHLHRPQDQGQKEAWRYTAGKLGCRALGSWYCVLIWLNQVCASACTGSEVHI